MYTTNRRVKVSHNTLPSNFVVYYKSGSDRRRRRVGSSGTGSHVGQTRNKLPRVYLGRALQLFGSGTAAGLYGRCRVCSSRRRRKAIDGIVRVGVAVGVGISVVVGAVT